MDASILVGVAWIAVAVLVASTVAVAVRTSTGTVWDSLADRWLSATESLTRRVGRPAAAGVVVAVGVAVTTVLCWGLGKLAGALESAVDWPIFHFFQSHKVGWWRHLNSVVTQMGNGTETQILTVVAAIVFAILWRRRWWVPFVTLIVGFGFERLLGQLLRTIVDRGHPPTTEGTWPSGGCARLILVVGLILFIHRRYRGLRSGRDAAWWWAGLAVLANVEAYTRVVLSKHWFTDAVGGMIFGSLLLVTMIAGFTVLDRRSEPGRGVGRKGTRFAQVGRSNEEMVGIDAEAVEAAGPARGVEDADQAGRSPYDEQPTPAPGEVDRIADHA